MSRSESSETTEGPARGRPAGRESARREPTRRGPTRRGARLIEGAIGPHLARMAAPMTIGILSAIAFSIIDTWFVAQLGTDELAAISFTFPVVMTLSSLTMGLGTGLASVMSRAIGENRRDRVQILATDGLLLALAIVLAFSIAGLLTIDPLFRAMGAPESLVPLIGDYMRIWYWGMVFLVVPMIGNYAIRATGDMRVPSMIMLGATILNAILDPILIFGLAGFPRLGIEGAAIATVLSRAVTLAAALAILHYREGLIAFGVPEVRRLARSWKAILHVGGPAAASNLIVPVSGIVVTAIVAGFGAAAVGGFGVATRIEAFTIVPLMGLAASLGPFVGQNFGAKRMERVLEAVRRAYLFTLLWCLGAGIVLWIAAPSIARLFDDDPVVVETASIYLRLVPVSYALGAFLHLTNAAFNAMGRPRPAVVLTAIRMLALYLPLVWIGSRLGGIEGMFWGAFTANVTIGLICFLWMRHVFRAEGVRTAPA